MTASFKAVMIGGVRWYQQHISANTPPCCKYYPTCSNYAIEALERYGAFKGGVLAVLRLLRCRPWSRGGIDDVPQRYSIFYRHSYCRGTRCLIFLSELMGPALSDLSLLLSRRLRTFGLYGYVAASFCREGSSRIAGRIYSIIFLLKYIKHPVFQNNSILYFVFFVKLYF